MHNLIPMKDFIKKPELIVEKAKIDSNEILPYNIYVKGGDSYGSGINEHGVPHFHVKSKIFTIVFKIPSTIEWHTEKDLILIEKPSEVKDYTVTKIKNIVIDWMDDINKDIPSITNFESLRAQWNILNKENKNVGKIL